MSVPKGANSFHVCIKLRPCESARPSLWQVKEGRSIQPADHHAEPCVFDHVFDEEASNQEVFDRMAQHIVSACMQGFNGTIIAYGQLSSGKTYTMMGDAQNPGVMVLAAKEIFQQIANYTEREFLLRVGHIEVYNEKIYDLLNKKQDLKIHESSNGSVNVCCEESIIASEDELLSLLCPRNKERTAADVHMSERCGRSHSIFRIIIESRKSGSSGDVIQSVLNLVDLGGHERTDPSSPNGPRISEGVSVNKSLFFLSKVIKRLSENVENEFINFRDSKLTRLLQASLSGNGLISIICTIKTSSMEESQSTLNFALLAKKIRIRPQLNEMVSDATMMKRLDCEINQLKTRLSVERGKNESRLLIRSLEDQIYCKILKVISSATLRGQMPSLDLTDSPKTFKEAEQQTIDSATKNDNALQIVITTLTASNQAANAKIKVYEEEVKTQNKTIERLEMENHESNYVLKTQLDVVKSELKALQGELMEAVQENDALRKEPGQRPLSIDSMKSSATEVAEPEQEPDTHLLQEEIDPRTIVSELQAEVESQLKQMQVKDRNIAELKAEIAEMRERWNWTVELQVSKDRYEAIVTTLKEQLLQAQEDSEMVVIKEKICEANTVTARHQAEIKELRSLKEKLLKAAEEQQQKLHSPRADCNLALNALKLENEKLKQDIRELQGKCEELDMNKLKQDKINLQLQNWRAGLKAITHEDLVSEHTELVGSSNKQIKELNERYEQLIIYTDNLREEKSILQVRIDEADAQHSETLKKLHKLEMEMDEMSKQKATEKSDLEEKLEIITAKMHDLEEELQSSKLKANRYDELTSEHKRLKSSLSEATGVSSDLQAKVNSLLSKLLAAGKEIVGRDLDIQNLRSDLKHALEAKYTVSAENVSLATQLQALEEEMSSRTCASLRAKSVELEETNTRLEEQMTKEAELKQKCSEITQKYEQGCLSIAVLTADCEKLRADLLASDAASNKCLEMDQKVEALVKEIERLQITLKSKETSHLMERDRTDATISSLLDDKRNLQEKQCTLTEIVSKLEAELNVLQALNSSFKSNNGSAASPTSAKALATSNLDRHTAASNAKKSINSDKAKRKDKRITAHDEHRRQACWRDSRDCGTMTDPEDSQSLSMKLQACQHDLKSESNTSSGSGASVARKRPAACVPRISGGITSEVRKSRRVTAHDELRSLSGWSDSMDCGTMTDPEDSQSLSMKLQACQQDLYYRNCEVFALNMELKQHKQRRDAQTFDSRSKRIAEPREK